MGNHAFLHFIDLITSTGTKDVHEIPYVESNVTECFEGDYVMVNCSVPMILMVSHPQWEFTFRNTSQSLVNDGKIFYTNELPDFNG